MFTSRLINVGDNLALIIPPKIIKDLGWKAGTEVNMSYDKTRKTILISAVLSGDSGIKSEMTNSVFIP